MARRKMTYDQALALQKAQHASRAAARRRQVEEEKPALVDWCQECGGQEGRHSNVCSKKGTS